MNILSIGSDIRVADRKSATARRQLAYASTLGTLTIAVFGSKKPTVWQGGALRVTAFPGRNPISFLRLHRSVCTQYLERPYDAVSSQDAFISGFLAWRISRRLGIPWVAQVHTDVASPYFRHQSLKTFAHWIVARFLLSRTARVRAVSERAAEGIRPWLSDPSRLVVLPLAWRPDDMPPSHPGREPFILMASRLTGEKRIGDAIRAFAVVRRHVPGLELRIAGEGSERKHLESLVRNLGMEDGVKFLGWRDDIPTLMSKASVFLLSSAFEGFGTVVAEAAAGRCPIIMTDVGCAGEMIRDRISGRVVPVGDIGALAAALEETLSDPECAQKYGNAGFAATAMLPDFDGYLRRLATSFDGLRQPGKVLFVTQTIDEGDTSLGFIPRWLDALRPRLPSLTVIVLRGTNSGIREYPVHILRRRHPSRAREALRYWSLIWRLRHSYDVVFVHMNQVYVLLGWPLLKLLGKRIVLWRNHPQGTLTTRFAVLLSDRVLCTSRNSFTARFGKTHIMPAGIDTDLFTPAPGHHDSRLVLAVGRISSIKRLEVFVEALGILRSRGTRFTARIVGDALPRDASLIEALRSRVRDLGLSDSVTFAPGIPMGRLPALYRSAAVVVNLTPPGSFDKVILEALACGTPVITANTDLRGSVDARCLVDPVDAESVAARLEEFLELPPSERDAIGTAARKYVLRRHGLDALVAGLITHLSLVGGGVREGRLKVTPLPTDHGRSHKRGKREREMSLIIATLRGFLNNVRSADVLEFGSGAGYQLPFLQQLGRVRASDVVNRLLPEYARSVEFFRCSIAETPFADATFDLIVSNHVIEHVDDLTGAFAELKRIGKPQCLYAFSVPTNWWLILSIPAQYANKVRALLRRLTACRRPGGHSGTAPVRGSGNRTTLLSRLLYFLLPNGHGEFRTFGAAFRAFKIRSWQTLFRDAGFEVASITPLLLYAPSEFPIIPTTRCGVRFGICSSVLFVLRKR